MCTKKTYMQWHTLTRRVCVHCIKTKHVCVRIHNDMHVTVCAHNTKSLIIYHMLTIDKTFTLTINISITYGVLSLNVDMTQ